MNVLDHLGSTPLTNRNQLSTPLQLLNNGLLSLCMLGLCLVWGVPCFVHAVMVSESSAKAALLYLEKFPYSHPLPLTLTVFPNHFCSSTQALGQVGISCLGWVLTPRPLILCMLISCGPLFVAIYCKKELFWGGLKDALVYGYNEKSLGSYLILCYISRIIVDSPLGPMTCLTRGFCLIKVPGMDCTVWSSPYVQSDSACYSLDTRVTTAPESTLISHYCSSQNTAK